MRRFRSEVLDWLSAGRILPGREPDVLRSARMSPTAAEWQAFLSHLTLWLGAVALAAAVIFFFAFNWDDLGRFSKFALVEAAILFALLVLWWLALDSAPGKAVLVVLSLLTGALLALTGQVYQTGADTFELFAWWAVLILPWVLIGRFSPLWLLWLVLLNLAVFLYFSLSWSGESLLWALFALNTLALATWEAAYRAGFDWLRDTWPPRLIALTSAVTATGLAFSAIFGEGQAADGLASLVWLGALYYWYRLIRFELFMLAAGVLSVIVTVAAWLSDSILDAGSGAFLVVGLAVIGMAGGGAVWLRHVARERSA